MKITIETPPPGGEDEIIIRAAHIDDRIMTLIQALKAGDDKLTAYHADGGIYLIDPADVYYFESVDDKVFAYGEKDVLEVKLKLYELESRLGNGSLIRISKSMILNLSKVTRFAPYAGGRFEALLQNGEKAVISRQYVPELKKRLGL